MKKEDIKIGMKVIFDYKGVTKEPFTVHSINKNTVTLLPEIGVPLITDMFWHLEPYLKDLSENK